MFWEQYCRIRLHSPLSAEEAAAKLQTILSDYLDEKMFSKCVHVQHVPPAFSVFGGLQYQFNSKKNGCTITIRFVMGRLWRILISLWKFLLLTASVFCLICAFHENENASLLVILAALLFILAVLGEAIPEHLIKTMLSNQRDQLEQLFQTDHPDETTSV